MTGEGFVPEGSEMMVRLASEAVQGVQQLRKPESKDAPGSGTISTEILDVVHDNHRQEVLRSMRAIRADNEERAIREETIWD